MPLFNKHKSYFLRYPNILIDDLSIEPKRYSECNIEYNNILTNIRFLTYVR